MVQLEIFNQIIINKQIEFCIISNNKNECKKIIENIAKTKYRDCPDCYTYDKESKIVYIYEHFEIDCSEHTKKGSKLG